MTKKKQGYVFLALLIPLFGFLCCSNNDDRISNPQKRNPEKGKPPTYTIEMLEGTAHVHNTASVWGGNSEIKLKPEGIIGDNGDENLTFFQPTDFTIDQSGCVYVLDSGNRRIQKLASDGSFYETFGKEGQGPGEFQYPAGISLDEKGNIYVTDTGTENMKILDPKGNEIQNLTWLRMSGHFDILSTGEIAIVRNQNRFRYSQTGDLMDLFDLEGRRITGFGKEEIHEEFDPFYLFNRIAAARDRDDFIYITYFSRNKIEKYSPSGKLLMVIDRPVNYEESTEVTYNQAKMGARDVDIAAVNQFSTGIDIDDKGRIWVLSNERQLEFDEMDITVKMFGENKFEGFQTLKASETTKTDAYAFHIFDQRGVFLGRIPIDHFAGIVRIFKDKLYILEPKHTMCIYKYGIIE